MKKVLVIEEQAQMRDLVLQGLSDQGFTGIGTGSGRIGLQWAQEHLPDVITCGVLMPELDGYSVLTSLRQDPATAVIPFIFVTAKQTRNDFRRAMELGANDYLTKPCEVEELLRAIAVQLEKQTVLQQWHTSQSRRTFETIPLPTGATPPSLPTTPPLSEVFRFIEANYHRAIALRDVAQAVDYSPAYLTNLMSRQTGKTVQRWIIERRMTAARSLLLETDELVEQIAAQVGYQHSVHFFRQFRQFHNTTPQAWRSAHRR
ncbi:DNA-binding response regulator [Myxacorys almedinensis]|uniref:response regulator transcription factor n=1 Tax=Myxacorys almedinensis TaxID=2651157 RepID=UPI003083CF75